ncbi:MAG: threonine ammonia-lyase [Thermoleophilia bacterium]|nr:threonine ammonia-lyase [Thermoleophilia bacterium]
MTAPTLADIRAARELLRAVARATPVHGSETLSRLASRQVTLKAETLQRTGSFKVRGAVVKLAALSEAERRAGVIAASAGNHGQAVAWAARELGIEAAVFMPADAPLAKIEATRSYGAEVVLSGASLEDAIGAAAERAASTGATVVHPFDDPAIVAGQGTIGLELDEQLGEVERVVVPVGGGGLCAGVAIALGELRPEARIVGVQAARCAPYTGSTEFAPTIADGIAVKRPGALTRPILERRLETVVTVSDGEIAQAIVLLLERTKLVVEGAGAAAVAALVAGRVPGDGPVCAILSGGNIDPTMLIQVARYGLTRAGRHLVVRTRVPDRPGQLARLLTRLGSEGANVLAVEHRREGVELEVSETGIELTLATRDEAHCAELLELMAGWGYPTERAR